MFTVKREEGDTWNQFHQLVYEYYNNKNRTFTHGATKIAEAQREAWSAGFRDFFSEVVASEVNRQRIEALVKWDTIPVTFGAEMKSAVVLLDGLWEKYVVDSTTVVPIDWTAFYSDVDKLIETFVWGQGIADQELTRHRDAVLGGLEEPTADDHGWLEAERQNAKDNFDRAQQLAMEAGRKALKS